MSELKIVERQAGDVTILDLEGKITIGEGSVALRTAVRHLLSEGKKKILLNQKIFIPIHSTKRLRKKCYGNFQGDVF
jgi:hypothetical protein